MTSKTEDAAINNYPFLSPRFWHGMRAAVWWRLLAKNGFKVSPSRLHIAFGVSCFTPINDVLAAVQCLTHGRKIRDVKIDKPPLFILGHWRSGTTFLHELLVTDPQFASPNTYQCFAPSHHLLTEYLMVRLGGFLLRKKRPMDQMDAGWRLRQEDEFALMNLGAPSPYLRIAFPVSQPKLLEFLSMEGIDENEFAQWSELLDWFMRSLTVRYPDQRLVMKSPPHTGRLGELANRYPGSKFIHLTRDPCKLYKSTLRLWRSLDEIQALQIAKDESELERYVTECLNRMYEGFEKARAHIDPSRIIDMRYEDLVADPKHAINEIYNRLDLGGIEEMEERLAVRLEGHGEYQTNKHPMSEEDREAILANWGDYARRYGYA